MSDDDVPPEGQPRSGFLASWWREITTVGPHQHAHWPAIRVGVCVTIPLATVLALGHVDWSPFVVFGSLGSVYGKQLDYAIRFRAQLETGVALIAAVVIGTAVGVIAPGSMLAVATMTAFSVLGLVITRTRGWLPVPSLFLVFATGTVSSYAHPLADIPLALVLSIAAAAMSLAIGQVGRLLPTSRRTRLPEPPRRSVRAVVMDRRVRREALLYVLGPLLAGTAATLSGVGHPYWAAVSATVPLIGTTGPAQLGRATLRFLGTLAGVAVAAGLLAPGLPPWALILAIAVLQVFTELFVARNYGIAVIAITPMALILTHLGAPGPLDRLIVDRIVETALGAGATLLVLGLARVLVHRRTGGAGV